MIIVSEFDEFGHLFPRPCLGAFELQLDATGSTGCGCTVISASLRLIEIGKETAPSRAKANTAAEAVGDDSETRRDEDKGLHEVQGRSPAGDCRHVSNRVSILKERPCSWFDHSCMDKVADQFAECTNP